jgi:selenocysteine-specific elongation factor
VSEHTGARLTLGTAGHIDHGKTVLVEALTGVNTDRLPEEQARGISIELGFAELVLDSGRRLGVVDVPGHERFVRTMVAGASGTDLFLLAVAADDGVMPQTEEHLGVLEMLAVPAGVVALTKVDTVDEAGVELAVEQVRDLLSGGPFERSEIVPVSAPQRTGLAELGAALDRAASAIAERRRDDGEPRLHVDRCFSLRGIGTVVTGTLWSGGLESGEVVRIEPSGKRARIRAVEVHGRSRRRADAGERVALNLAGLERAEIARGDVVTGATATIEPTYLLDCSIELTDDARPLRRGARLQLHHGTRETPARVAPLSGDTIAPGAPQYTQLRLERPVVAVAGDRIILRQIAPPATIGGGVVLDPHPRKHGADQREVERLHLLEHGDELDRLADRLARSPSGIGERDAEPELLERLLLAGRARRVGARGARYFAPSRLEGARSRLLAALRASDTATPLSRGALADAAGVSDAAARAVLEQLVGEDAIVGRDAGYLARERAAFRDPRAERVLATLREDGLEPRGVDALATTTGLAPAELRTLLDGLASSGHLARVKPGVYYDPAAISEVERRVTSICERDGAVTIATLRDELATSRKYAQALLEFLDGAKVTLRQGDRHVLRGRTRDNERRPSGRLTGL